jgi:N-acetylmuramoyl-L-alanine amidase
VLAIAKNVRSILRSNGIDARLTRSGDTFIPLYDRVEIAHQHGADLFMSIHADGFTNPSAAGASVFALSTAAPVAPWQSISRTVKTGRMKWPARKRRIKTTYCSKCCSTWYKLIPSKTA